MVRKDNGFEVKGKDFAITFFLTVARLTMILGEKNQKGEVK